jgi:hypothetical protein
MTLSQARAPMRTVCGAKNVLQPVSPLAANRHSAPILARLPFPISHSPSPLFTFPSLRLGASA